MRTDIDLSFDDNTTFINTEQKSKQDIDAKESLTERKNYRVNRIRNFSNLTKTQRLERPQSINTSQIKSKVLRKPDNRLTTDSFDNESIVHTTLNHRYILGKRNENIFKNFDSTPKKSQIVDKILSETNRSVLPYYKQYTNIEREYTNRKRQMDIENAKRKVSQEKKTNIEMIFEKFSEMSFIKNFETKKEHLVSYIKDDPPQEKNSGSKQSNFSRKNSINTCISNKGKETSPQNSLLSFNSKASPNNGSRRFTLLVKSLRKIEPILPKINQQSLQTSTVHNNSQFSNTSKRKSIIKKVKIKDKDLDNNKSSDSIDFNLPKTSRRSSKSPSKSKHLQTVIENLSENFKAKDILKNRNKLNIKENSILKNSLKNYAGIDVEKLKDSRSSHLNKTPLSSQTSRQQILFKKKKMKEIIPKKQKNALFIAHYTDLNAKEEDNFKSPMKKLEEQGMKLISEEKALHGGKKFVYKLPPKKIVEDDEDSDESKESIEETCSKWYNLRVRYFKNQVDEQQQNAGSMLNPVSVKITDENHCKVVISERNVKKSQNLNKSLKTIIYIQPPSQKKLNETFYKNLEVNNYEKRFKTQKTQTNFNFDETKQSNFEKSNFMYNSLQMDTSLYHNNKFLFNTNFPNKTSRHAKSSSRHKFIKNTEESETYSIKKIDTNKNLINKFMIIKNNYRISEDQKFIDFVIKVRDFDDIKDHILKGSELKNNVQKIMHKKVIQIYKKRNEKKSFLKMRKTQNFVVLVESDRKSRKHLKDKIKVLEKYTKKSEYLVNKMSKDCKVIDQKRQIRREILATDDPEKLEKMKENGMDLDVKEELKDYKNKIAEDEFLRMMSIRHSNKNRSEARFIGIKANENKI